MANVGASVTFTNQFTSIAGAAADPTVVRFFLREEIDGTELEWLFNAVPVEGTNFPVGANAMVKDSTGLYHVLWVARKPERLTGFWLGTGTVFQSSSSTQFINHSILNLAGG